jgi:hypothetical protein
MQQNFIIYIILYLIITSIPSLWFVRFFLYIPKDKELEFASVPIDIVRGLNSLLTFGSWTLWKHHIDYVFSGTIPSIQLVLGHILDEAHLYCLAVLEI